MNEIEDLDLDLLGRTIVGVRSMTQHEIYVFGWDEYVGMQGDAVVIELDNGALLVPSRDAELNGGGQMMQVVPSDNPEDQPEGVILLHLLVEGDDQ
mgnify:CR=1 FL=1|tara:strand:+ start:1228 stop:1515 length:288 start_codon:yes stop_codon:yes gene_type:complete